MGNTHSLDKRAHWFLLVLLLIGSSLFFVGGPNAWSPLVFYYLWNLGHALFFFAVVFCIHQLRPLVFGRDWLLIIAVVLLVGIIIEFIQQFVGRVASVSDVLTNLYGALLGLAVTGGSITNRWQLYGARLLSIALLLPLSTSTIYAAYADLRMRAQFPVINDFERRYELQQIVQIGARVTRAQSAEHVANGRFSLAVELGTGKYSGIKWLGRYGDWSSYRFFAMDVYNAGDTPFEMVLKIADLQHDKGSNLSTDRFNQYVTLSPGHNTVRVDLSQIRHAPAERPMQMSAISCLELFGVNLREPRRLYIDYLRLE